MTRPTDDTDAQLDELITVEEEIVERAPTEPGALPPLAERASELVDEVGRRIVPGPTRDRGAGDRDR